MFEGTVFDAKGSSGRTLGNTLNHEALYQAYRSWDIPVRSTGMNFGIAGAYDPEKNAMYLAGGKPPDVRNTVLHEMQHAIQGIEGTAPGGSVGEWLPANHHEMSKRSQRAFVADREGSPRRIWDSTHTRRGLP